MDYSKMNDRSLTILAKRGDPAAIHHLYNRYKNFVYNHWSKLKMNLEKINNKTYINNLSSLKTDFENDSYLAFSEALDYVNIDEIKNDKWKFLGPYGWYLSNLRRTYRRKALKTNREMSPFVSFGDDESNLLDNTRYAHISAEDEYIKIHDEQRADLFLSNMSKYLNSEELSLSSLRRNGASISEIKSKMNITTNSYYKITNSIKEKVSKYMNS